MHLASMNVKTPSINTKSLINTHLSASMFENITSAKTNLDLKGWMLSWHFVQFVVAIKKTRFICSSNVILLSTFGLCVGRWIEEVSPTFQHLNDMLNWIDNQRPLCFRREIIDMTSATLIWVLCMYQNIVVFGGNTYKKDLLFDSVVSFSF